MSAAQPQQQTGRALDQIDAAAWLAVAAGTIGSFMATLDISIVNAALPTIQGEVGASSTEGTWISTSYLVSEIVMIPLTGWLVRVVGLRSFLLWCAILFTGFSILCGISQSLFVMIIGRVGQGFAGGALIPTALTIVATRLPPSQQPVGTALFGMTVILGPVIGPLLGGWLTENATWHYAFFINIPVCIGLVVLLFVGLPREPTNWRGLLQADWLGIYGLCAGLGSVTVILEEGQRERWFESTFINTISLICVTGFGALIASQFRRQPPAVRLTLMRDRSFSAVLIMVMAVGMILFGVMYMVPQFLTAIAGYNAQQSGYVILMSGLPTLLLMPVMPKLLDVVDVRVLVATGLICFCIACYHNMALTSDSVGVHFAPGLLLQGCGLALTMLPLNQAAISMVEPALASDASGLFSAARNLGGSVGLALISIFEEQRLTFHTQRLGSAITANSSHAQQVLKDLAVQAGAVLDAPPNAVAIGQLAQTLNRQALVMTYSDLFWIFGTVVLCCLPLALLLRPLPKGGTHAMH